MTKPGEVEGLTEAGVAALGSDGKQALLSDTERKRGVLGRERILCKAHGSGKDKI